MRSASSANSWRPDDDCCPLLLPEDQKGRFRDSEPACELVGDTGIEPVTSSV
jgi:hypothetical protein